VFGNLKPVLPWICTITEDILPRKTFILWNCVVRSTNCCWHQYVDYT